VNHLAHYLIIGGSGIAILFVVQHYSFLLFHVMIEMFSVVVASAIFLFAWNTRTHIQNGGIIILGAAFLVIGGIDLLHTLAYKGMGVLEIDDANIATQLWIAARYIESLTLLVVPLFSNRIVILHRAVYVYLFVFALVVGSIFFWPIFPSCFAEGEGLTRFKKISEYVIAAILLVGLWNLMHRRREFNSIVFLALGVSIVLTIASELAFTFYVSVYGLSNFVGHLFKLVSFWLIYKAIIETGLQRPYALLFRELAQSETRYRELVAQLPTGICEIDPELRITYINPAGLRLIGYDDEDMRLGIRLDRVVDEADRQKARQWFAQLVNKDTAGSASYRLKRKDEALVDVIVNCTPIHRQDRIVSIQASLTDVTEMNRLQHQLQQAKKMEAIAVLAGGMAHKVNNMLMGVVGHLELMKMNAAERRLNAEDFTKVFANCERIAELIQKVLAYARGGRYQDQPIEMAEFVQNVLEEHMETYGRGITFSHDFPSGLPRVSADPTQLQMVVSAVVSNAVEAIEESGRIDIALLSVEMDEEQCGQMPGMIPGRYVRFTVRDTGKGMDTETLQRIFEPFYTHKFTGRGLGMPAVYGIVKNHGGWIGVDSNPGQGTTVEIYLPAI
jgi:PAS domain S-box-containing protein